MEKTRKRRGTGRVTLQEVANFAGVGTMTVSRALRTPEQVSEVKESYTGKYIGEMLKREKERDALSTGK